MVSSNCLFADALRAGKRAVVMDSVETFMKEVSRATSLVLIAIGALIGALVLEQLEIKDPTLRFSVVQATKTLGSIIDAILVTGRLLEVYFATIGAEAPQLYERVKSHARITTLALLALGGWAGVLVTSLSNHQESAQPVPLGIAAVFAWIAIFALRRIRKNWWVWTAYRRLHTDRSRI